jgi:hypothetical protein
MAASWGAVMAGNAKRPGYDELAGQVAALREQVRALKAELHRLRSENARLRGERPPVPDADAEDVAAAVPRGRKTPPRWAKANVVRVPMRRPRRPRAPVPGRRREVPDRIVLHAPAVCPACATPLGRGRVVSRRQVIDLPPVRAEIVEHRVLERRCAACGTRCRGALPDLSEQMGAHRRVSWRVAALVAVLRTKLRLPITQVQWLLAQVWGVRLAVGTLCGLLAEAARAARPAYAGFLAEARASPVLHLDETGWREAGRNGWVWTLTTPTVRLFRFSVSRAGAVARALLGDDTEGVIVSDFYTAYDQLDGRHQRCWAHLLREIHDLTVLYPADASVQAWALEVGAVYRRAVACPATTARERHWARRCYEQSRLGLCAPYLADATAPQRRLCARIERHLAELFVFVVEPGVPPDNNAAERSLRHLVTSRKISGGTRSAAGTDTKMTLSSLFGTWRAQGHNPYHACRQLLTQSGV